MSSLGAFVASPLGGFEKSALDARGAPALVFPAGIRVYGTGFTATVPSSWASLEWVNEFHSLTYLGPQASWTGYA